MRPLAFAVPAAVVVTCAAALATRTPAAAAPEPRPEAASLEALAWLAGAWEGTLGSAAIEEHWTPAAGGTMLGVGRAVAGERMVSFEFLRLEERPDGLVYVAHPNAGAGTEFRCTSASEDEVVFENPEHDFPTLVRYRRTGEDAMEASIEGPRERGTPLTFRFRRN